MANKKTVSSIPEDSRFADLFKDEEFQVDKTSNEYKIHHPTESKKIDFSSFQPIKEDAEGSSSAFDSSSEDDSDDEPAGRQWYEIKD